MKDIEEIEEIKEVEEKYLTIHIGGEPYRVKNFEKDKHYIRKLETYLNKLIVEIKIQFPAASTARVMGIMSLRLAEELFELKKTKESLELSKLKNDIETLFQHIKTVV